MDIDSDWRDWASHPEAVTAMWPRVLASGMPPATCLALLGTCLPTCNAVLHEAPRAKLSLQLRPTQPVLPASMLQLLGGRTQPTILSLLNSSTGPTAAAAAQPPLAPALAGSNAQNILGHHALLNCSCITRLDLQGVLVDPPLLMAMQGLPALAHLHLSNSQLPVNPCYEAAHLPQSLHTLHIELQSVADDLGSALNILLYEFFQLDTITDLTITSTNNGTPGPTRDCHIITGMTLAALPVQRTQALRKLCLPGARLRGLDIKWLQRGAPLLQELQVYSVDGKRQEDGRKEVSWLTLCVRDLDLGCCDGLPLGGTTPLDIHVSGRLLTKVGDGSQRVLASVRHLTSQQTRPARLVGAGVDGGAFSWDNACYDDPSMLVSGLSALLQLSKAPLRSLDLTIRTVGDGEQLLLALQPLLALSHLSLKVDHWYDLDGHTPDQLLAQLPLHVQRVRLLAAGDVYELEGRDELFSRMAVLASKVPARQARPLHLCVVGEGPGSGVWRAVENRRARGDMGVVMEQLWE